MSEDGQKLSNDQRFQSATPSVKELEYVLDSCRIELNHGDEVWPNLYIDDMKDIVSLCVLCESRSIALVLAYFMIYHYFLLADAVQSVVQHRAILPNPGFLKQLQDLNVELQYKTNRCEFI